MLDKWLAEEVTCGGGELKATNWLISDSTVAVSACRHWMSTRQNFLDPVLSCVCRAPVASSRRRSPLLEPLWLSSSNGQLASSIPTATLQIRSPEFPVFGLLLYCNQEYSGLLRVDFTTMLSFPLFCPYTAFSQLPTLLRLCLVSVVLPPIHSLSFTFRVHMHDWISFPLVIFYFVFWLQPTVGLVLSLISISSSIPPTPPSLRYLIASVRNKKLEQSQLLHITWPLTTYFTLVPTHTVPFLLIQPSHVPA